MLKREIVVMICSRGREAILARLLDDLLDGFLPALAEGGWTASVFVYAQLYGEDYLDSLAARHAKAFADGRLLVVPSERPHTRIGDVVHTAITAMHERLSYRLAMLIDDDSLYTPDTLVEDNLRRAVAAFVDGGQHCFSIKLGQERDFVIGPFLDTENPIAPFKEKMIWVSRAVLDDVLALPHFSDLSIAEDTVITALAWLRDPDACRSVHGIASFVHFGAETLPGLQGGEVAGGYADLVGFAGPPTAAAPHGKYDEALRSGVTHWHVMPDVFVGADHPHFIYAGLRADAVLPTSAVQNGSSQCCQTNQNSLGSCPYPSTAQATPS
ncbi:MAG: hypothetical protein Q8O26_02505 [Phreatobacter sp.]|uniref:hypothetical protein n=1 Tax=Phreatobacter sp. TaxID=1966341 RepID=UPI002733F336|nr:hypothetical protein [Phreatobacter sp.]MDP2800730.1 hypothetical protein [Phreatobacter sp.]